MKKLQDVLDTYGRYLDTLKNKETDVKKNYSAMKAFIEQNCEEWLKKHMFQDAFINTLRFNRGQYNLVEPSSRIKLLMDSNDFVDRVKTSLKASDREGFSWTPTLYKYFRPKDEFELASMEMELEQMNNIGLVAPIDYKLVKENIFNPKRQYFQRLEKQETKSQEMEIVLAE